MKFSSNNGRLLSFFILDILIINDSCPLTQFMVQQGKLSGLTGNVVTMSRLRYTDPMMAITP